MCLRLYLHTKPAKFEYAVQQQASTESIYATKQHIFALWPKPGEEWSGKPGQCAESQHFKLLCGRLFCVLLHLNSYLVLIDIFFCICLQSDNDWTFLHHATINQIRCYELFTVLLECSLHGAIPAANGWLLPTFKTDSLLKKCQKENDALG